MAISKKGARKIHVNGVDYLYKVSKVKKKSVWREQNDELNDTFMKYASYFGLGEVRDITINIVVQLSDRPVSTYFIKIHTLLVSGFMGPEQITQIKPKFVRELIFKGLKDGWNPAKEGDARLTILESQTKEHQPLILQLPDMNEGVEDYQNLERPIEIKLDQQEE
ncbi:MAG: hypothetical protein AAF696_03740, partial [Bacteroidota bacterium]